MKRAVLVAAAIAVAVPAAGMPPTAFGAELSSTPRHHHEKVHHRQGPTLAKAAHSRQISPQARAQVSADGMSAKILRPDAEWDCFGRDGECSWEPSGWGGAGN